MTAAENTIRMLYPTTPAGTIADMLGMSKGQVYTRAHAMGLHKSREEVARMARERMTPEHPARQYWIQKGAEPWNKGVQGRTGHHPNTRATQFKKGRKPQEASNYQPIGTLRVCAKDGYLQRKVSDDTSINPAQRWEFVHRSVWVAANGPIPPGHIVVFKRGMVTAVLEDITPERLECITRAENMRRNSYHTRHPEMVKLYQLKGAINRQANRIAREAQEPTP